MSRGASFANPLIYRTQRYRKWTNQDTRNQQVASQNVTDHVTAGEA